MIFKLPERTHTNTHTNTYTHIYTHTSTSVSKFEHPLTLLQPHLVHRNRELIEEQIEMYFCLSECLADQLAASQLDDHVSTALKHVVYVRLCHSYMEMSNSQLRIYESLSVNEIIQNSLHPLLPTYSQSSYSFQFCRWKRDLRILLIPPLSTRSVPPQTCPTRAPPV